MLYVGCVFGIVGGNAAAHASGLDAFRVWVATFVLLSVALVGARLLFVVTHWSFFRNDLRRIWDRTEGGAAQYGGLLLARTGVVAAALRTGRAVRGLLGCRRPHDSDRHDLHARGMSVERLLRRPAREDVRSRPAESSRCLAAPGAHTRPRGGVRGRVAGRGAEASGPGCRFLERSSCSWRAPMRPGEWSSSPPANDRQARALLPSSTASRSSS